MEAGLPEPALKEEQGGFLSKIFKDRFTEDQLKKMEIFQIVFFVIYLTLLKKLH